MSGARATLIEAGLIDPARALAERLSRRTDIEDVTRVREAILDKLAATARCYRENGLSYHNTDHLRDCLAVFGRVGGLAQDADAVETALWYHDAVYIPRSRDNEKASAEKAVRELSGISLPTDWVQRVKRLVLSTRHDQPSETPDERLIRDIDLAVLGRPSAEYQRYAQAIRQEYPDTDEADYNAGRSQVLRAFLDRQRIYETDWFFSRYESAARKNLRSELQRLASAR